MLFSKWINKDKMSDWRLDGFETETGSSNLSQFLYSLQMASFLKGRFENPVTIESKAFSPYKPWCGHVGFGRPAIFQLIVLFQRS